MLFRSRLAFQLEGGIARRAEIVDGGCALRGWPQMRRFAGRAEEIRRAPGFGTDASALGGAFVAIQPLCRQLQLHACIRSFSLGEINLGFGFDDEEDLDACLRTGAEILPGFFKRFCLD